MEARAGRLLLGIARRSSNEYVEAQSEYEPALDGLPEALRQKGASIVTPCLAKQLRGCIASVEPQRPLAIDIACNAVASPARDLCSLPVTCDELPAIQLAVTVLSPLQPESVIPCHELAAAPSTTEVCTFTDDTCEEDDWG